VEHGLEELEADRWGEVLNGSRQREPLPASDAAIAAGVSYRQFNAWHKAGIVVARRAERGRRWFDDDAIVRAIWLRSVYPFLDSGTRETLSGTIAATELHARYLVVTDRRLIRTASTGSELLDLLAEPGAHHVTDQLPLRLRLLGWGSDVEREVDDGEIADAL
jgi:hypothetical protein